MIFKEYISKSSLDLIFESGMSVAQIARELGVTKEAVHKTLKKASGKLFIEMEKLMPDADAFKVLLSVATALGIESQEDFNTLKKMLPKDILKRVEADAQKYLSKKQRD